MMNKKQKDNILVCIQERTPLTYATVKQLYEITKSYDAILDINDMALKFNRDVIELAQFLYRSLYKKVLQKIFNKDEIKKVLKAANKLASYKDLSIKETIKKLNRS